jgi:hypothetical protein
MAAGVLVKPEEVMRTTGRSAITALFVSVALSCHAAHDTNDRAVNISVAAAAADVARLTRSVDASLDSCNAVRWPGDTAGTVVGQKSAWGAGTIRTFGLFSLFVPDRANIVVVDTTLGSLTLTWSDCPGCSFGVDVAVDSARTGIEGRVAQIVAAQRVIDSINRDPRTTAMEFDDIDGPPEPFTAAAGRGYRIDGNCGDCIAISLLFGRPGYIATVAIGGTDDVPMLPRHVCEMIVLGKTLRWRADTVAPLR